MPGSTAEDPAKAKVTTANGVFVRPVAVAGIFRPAEDKPPALPEKRRFSALVGDLRPCSSGDKSEDFLRRRQSWDAKQKEVPFGQALLRKTPRNTSAVQPEIAKNGGQNNTLKGNEGGSSAEASPISKQIPSLEQSTNSNVPNHPSKNSSLLVCDEKRSISYIKPSNKSSDSKIIIDETSSKNAPSHVSQLPTSKESEINGCLVKDNLNNTSNSTENVKQPKKIYGLIKRDIRQDSSEPKISYATDNATESSVSSVTVSHAADVTKSKSKVYGLSKANLKKESIEIQTNQEVSDKNIKVVEKTIGNSTKEKEQKCDSKSLTSASVIDKVSTVKDTELRNHDSPPKDFRPMRRTSDVIAAKIQNIFSKASSSSSTLSKKSVTKIEGNTEKSANLENLKSSEKLSSCLEQTNRPKSDNLNLINTTIPKNEANNSTKEVSKIKKISIKSNVAENQEKIINFKQNEKGSSTADKISELNLSTKKCDSNGTSKKCDSNGTSKKCDSNGTAKKLEQLSSSGGLSSQGKLSENAAVVNVESPLQVDSKTKRSINATLSTDKKIQGTMPIKKTDQNSSDGTLLLKAPNQESDRKSPDSASSLSTTMGDFNNGAIPKKNIGVIIINKSSPLSCEKISSVISSSCNSTVNKVQKIVKTDISRNGLVETVSTKETSITQNAIKLNSSNVISKNTNNLSILSLNSKVQINRDSSNVHDNGVIESNEIAKVEVTKITPSTVPGIVPTVNVLFRTKSPQGSAIKEENRKKVVVETSANLSSTSSSIIQDCANSKSPLINNVSSATESVKEALHAVQSVQNCLASPKFSAKHAIVNLQNEELATVSLSPISNKTDIDALKEISEAFTPKDAITSKRISSEVLTSPVETCKVEIKTASAKIDLNSKTSADSIALNTTEPKFLSQSSADVRNSSSATCLYNTEKLLGDYSRSTSETKMSVVDLGDWSKKFQRVELEAPRAPLRRRFQRESLPPSLPLRSTPSRFGSLKRIEDSTRYIPRSPSQSSLPQRYSYSEMLSKVCSMGVLPYVEPLHSKSCSSSSSQVSELWSELGEEQSTATHASEMLEAETSERMRLEKEVQELQNRYSQVQQRSDKMEMEIMESRVYRTPELNGDISEDDDPEANGSLYKQKYERAIRDMEIMKRRMQQQHEEEMEQKSMLKKASDKRLAEALEDVEEERQVANQWKRKAQKLGAELQDLRLMLEEQMTRNGELEKKQRRFDAELSAAQEEMKKEKVLKEKFSREKDQAVHEKYSLEQDLQASKIDSDMLHEKITQLNRELDELTLSSKGEEEVTQLKRAKQELERKNRDQEEELEELAAQVQMLEQAKLRLEMSLEKVRQEHRREASVREEEIEEIRASFSKKIKNLEAQLESEQDERHQLVKQKHELERYIYELSDQPPPQDPEIERRLRRDLKRTKALLRDAQSMLEHTREGQSGKTLIRQLKNQLEDSEFAKAAAVKARQAVEAELQESQTQLEEVTRVKNECESRCLQLSREKSAIQTQLEEAEEEMTEVMKKYKAVVAQMSIDQKSLAEQNQQIAELETERQMLKDQLSEVSHKFEHLATQSEDTHKVHRLDSKVRDLESKLELEQTTRSRLEHQITRLKEQNDRMREECDSLRNKELQAQEGVRRLQRQLRDLRDDYASLQQKEAEAYRKQHELEMALENIETDLQVTKNDLRLALQRIQDLQNALEDDLDSGTDVPDDSGSDSDSSLELSVLRNSSVTPVQRCESVASNLSYDIDGPRSRTSSFSLGLSAFSSRNDVEKDFNGFSGLNDSSQLLDADNDERV